MSTPVGLADPEIVGAGEALGRAFFDDPGYAYIVPRDHARHGVLVDWLCTFGVRLGQCAGRVTRTAGDRWGVLVSFPPGAYPVGLWPMVQAGALQVPFKLGPAILKRFLHWMTVLERHHARNMPRPHWYIFLIGVDPPAQGQGLGNALLRPLFEEADVAGVPCYLETFNPDNLPFYRRHGFEVIDEVKLTPNGPPFWTMRRAPAARPGGLST